MVKTRQQKRAADNDISQHSRIENKENNVVTGLPTNNNVNINIDNIYDKTENRGFTGEQVLSQLYNENPNFQYSENIDKYLSPSFSSRVPWSPVGPVFLAHTMQKVSNIVGLTALRLAFFMWYE